MPFVHDLQRQWQATNGHYGRTRMTTAYILHWHRVANRRLTRSRNYCHHVLQMTVALRTLTVSK